MQSIVQIDKRIVCIYYIIHQILKTKVSDIQGPGVIYFHTFISLYLVEEEAPSSSWTVCSSLKATRFSVPDLEEPPFLVAGVGGGCSRWGGWGGGCWCCFFDACEDEEEAGESPCNMNKIDFANLFASTTKAQLIRSNNFSIRNTFAYFSILKLT